MRRNHPGTVLLIVLIVFGVFFPLFLFITGRIGGARWENPGRLFPRPRAGGSESAGASRETKFGKETWK